MSSERAISEPWYPLPHSPIVPVQLDEAKLPTFAFRLWKRDRASRASTNRAGHAADVQDRIYESPRD